METNIHRRAIERIRAASQLADDMLLETDPTIMLRVVATGLRLHFRLGDRDIEATVDWSDILFASNDPIEEAFNALYNRLVL